MQTTTSKLDLAQLSSQAEALHLLLNEFFDILEEESNCIKANQADQLLTITHSKQTLSEKIEEATTQFNTFLEPQGLNLTSLISDSTISLPANLKVQTTDIAKLIQDCHDKNLANGMSIQMLSNINQHALDLISGKTQQDVKLYGSSGEKTHLGNSSSLGKA